MPPPPHNDPRRDPSWKPDPRMGTEPRKKILGVPVPSLRPGPKSDPGTKAASADPWVQRIGALTALVVALAGAGLGGAKMTERDVPTEETAEKLAKALEGCQREVAGLRKKIEDDAAREIAQTKKIEEQSETIAIQARQLKLHAEVIHLLNGRVSPTWKWPESRAEDWLSGPDNMHRHTRRGGRYPGTED